MYKIDNIRKNYFDFSLRSPCLLQAGGRLDLCRKLKLKHHIEKIIFGR
jgi:hypothetical protein